MNDDPDLLPVQVVAPASDTRPLRHPRVEPPEIDDRDLDRMISPPRVSPFASTERITAPPPASSQPAQQRRLEPSPWPSVNPSPMPLLRVPFEAKNAPGASSDAMPAQNRLSRAASSLRMDGMGSMAVLSWVSSHRGVLIGGAGLTVILLLIAFAATRGSDPDTAPAIPATAIHAGPQSATGSPAPAHDAATSPPNTRDRSAAGAAVPTTSPASPSVSSPASPVSPPGLRNPAKVIALSSPPRDIPAETDDDVPETERARAAYNEGNHALFEGNSDAAIRAYRQALSAAPTFPPGFRGLGLAYAQKGQNGLAIMSLRTYLTKAPHAKDAALIKQRIAALQSSNP
jgi:hypothetical protein